MKEESRRLFLEFWGEPAESPRWSRDGIYTSYVFGPAGRRVQVILPDLRFNRTPIAKLDLGTQKYKEWEEAKRKAGQFVPGPYARSPDPAATMLGERQWSWLEKQFEVPAELRIVASSLQVLADFPGWEGWINYARDHQRLIDADSTQARFRRGVHQRRHSLRRALEAGRERAVHLLGSHFERADRGVARRRAECESSGCACARTQLRADRDRLVRYFTDAGTSGHHPIGQSGDPASAETHRNLVAGFLSR